MEVAGEHELERDFVGCGGQTEADAGFDTCKLGGVIEDSPQLMRLIVSGQEVLEGAGIGILLDGYGPFGRQIVSDARAWGEVEILEAAEIGIIENGVDDDVPGMQVQAEDGPNLRRVAAGIPMLGVVTEFEIHGVNEGAVVGMRLGKEQAQLAAIDGGAAVLGVDSVKRQIETGFEPVGDAVGPFGRAVPGLVWDEAAGEGGRLLSVGGEVVVHCEIDDAGRGNGAIVDLDFVGLRKGPGGERKQSGGERETHQARAQTQVRSRRFGCEWLQGCFPEPLQ